MGWMPTHDRAPLQHRRAGRILPAAAIGTYLGTFSNTSRWNYSRCRHGVGFRKGPRDLGAGRLSSVVIEYHARRRWPGPVWHVGPRTVPGRRARSSLRRRRDRLSVCGIWPSRTCLGPSTRAIVEAAKAIATFPYRRLNDHSLVQFGYGRNSAASRRRRPTAPARSPRPLPRTRK
jgi:hypothetical protein